MQFSSRDLFRSASTVVGFIALGALVTWPLPLHLADTVPGAGPGDNLQFVWNFWWMRHALSTPGDHFWRSDFLFYPAGFSLVQHTHTALGAFFGATVLWPMSVVEALNVTIWANITLAGYCAYLLAKDVTRRHDASIAAGVLFAASPYVAAHLHGHFNLLAAWLLPLFALLLLKALRMGSRVAGFAAGLVLVMAAYSDYYYLIYCIALGALIVGSFVLDARVERALAWRPQAMVDRVLVGMMAAALLLQVFIWSTGGLVWHSGVANVSLTTGTNIRTAVWVMGFTWLWRRTRPRLSVRPAESRTLLTPIVSCLVALLLGALPVIIGAVRLWWTGDYATQKYFWRSGPEGVDVAALVAGNPFHPLWGPFVTRVYAAFRINPIESVAWLGAATIVFLFWSRKRWIGDPAGRLWLTIAAVFLLWALGPRLLAFGADTGLILPGILLRYVPVAANARIPGRAMVMVYLAAAMLLAVAIASAKRRQTPIAAMLIGLVLADFWSSPIPVFHPDRPPVYERLAAAPPGAVCELPLGLRDGFGEIGAFDDRVLYYQTIHQKPLVGGFSARLSESVKRDYRSLPIVRSLLALSGGEALDARTLSDDRTIALRILRQNGIRYFVLNRETASTPLEEYVRTVLPLKPLAFDDSRDLYEVNPW